MEQKKFVELEIKVAGDEIEIIASDETLDRHGDVLNVDSWDLRNYLANPVLLVDHDYRVENIVGVASKIRIEKSTPRRMIFSPLFHDITEKARNVAEMVKQGILKTVSVGFIAHGPEKDSGTDRYELLEISFVPVPANPSAEMLAYKSVFDKKGIDEAEAKKVEAFVKQEEEIEVEVHPEEEPELPKEGDEAPVVEDHTPEAMEERGWKIIKSVDELTKHVKEQGEQYSCLTLCDTDFLLKLVSDLQTVQADLQKAMNTKTGRSLIQENTKLLKKVAREINLALYKTRSK